MANAFIYRYNRDGKRPMGATQWVVMITIAVTALQFLSGGFDGEGMVYKQGVLLAGPVWQGEVWRVLSYALLHGGLLHIFMNLWFIFSLGQLYEDTAGTKPFIVVYIASALLGGVAVLLFGSYMTGVVGASGGAFGILGAVLASMYVRLGSLSRMWQEPYSQHLLVITIFMLVIGAVHESISGLGHAGGLVAGLLMGYLIATHRQRGLAQLEKLGAVVLVLLMAGATVYSFAPVHRGAWRATMVMQELGLKSEWVRVEGGYNIRVVPLDGEDAKFDPSPESVRRAQEFARQGLTDAWDDSEVYTIVSSRVAEILRLSTQRLEAKEAKRSTTGDD